MSTTGEGHEHHAHVHENEHETNINWMAIAEGAFAAMRHNYQLLCLVAAQLDGGPVEREMVDSADIIQRIADLQKMAAQLQNTQKICGARLVVGQNDGPSTTYICVVDDPNHDPRVVPHRTERGETFVVLPNIANMAG